MKLSVLQRNPMVFVANVKFVLYAQPTSLGLSTGDSVVGFGTSYCTCTINFSTYILQRSWTTSFPYGNHYTRSKVENAPFCLDFVSSFT